MPMTLNEAREIGAAKLNIDRALFDKCLVQAKRMRVEADDLGPMALAIGLLGVSRADKSDIGLRNEMLDAMDVIRQAENEWRMQQKIGRKARLS